MSVKIDKSLILKRIKSHYNFKTNSQLARFFGIATNTLANWHTRNAINYDLVFTKCDELNPNWIVTGEGRAVKGYPNLEENEPLLTEEEKEALYLKTRRTEEIERLHNIINLQGETIAAQGKTIQMMEKLLETGKSK